MRVEELKQGHDQLFDSNVSIAIFLDVVAHGLSLRLSKKVSGLFLQHGPTLVHQTGESHLRTSYSFIKARLELQTKIIKKNIKGITECMNYEQSSICTIKTFTRTTA